MTELAVRSAPLLPSLAMLGEPATNAFRALLKSLVARYGSRDALGRAIGMSGSRVGRALSGQYAFSIANCLKLAEVTGESPAVVLRSAGKSAVAAMLERLYGVDGPRVSQTDLELLSEWQRLSPRARECLRHVVQELTAVHQVAEASSDVHVVQEPQEESTRKKVPPDRTGRFRRA